MVSFKVHASGRQYKEHKPRITKTQALVFIYLVYLITTSLSCHLQRGINVVTTPHKTCETYVLALVTQHSSGLTIVYCYLLCFILNINYLSYCLNNLSNISLFFQLVISQHLFTLVPYQRPSPLGVLSQGTFLTTLCIFTRTHSYEYKHLEKMKGKIFS